MPKYESSLTNKEFAGGQQKRFVVSDDDVPVEMQQVHQNEQSLSDMEAQFNEARRAKKTAASTIGAEAKKRFEILSGLGRATRDVVIDGVTFSLRSIKAKELREVVNATLQMSNKAEEIFEARAHTLARVVYKIDGHDIGIILGNDSLEAKLEFVQQLDEEVAQHLYREYDDLLNSHKKLFSTQQEEIKEVGEDLKKSS